MRRSFALAISLTLVVTLAILAYLWLEGVSDPAADPLVALPSHAALVIQAHGLEPLLELRATSRIWATLADLGLLARADTLLALADTLSARHPGLGRLLSQGPLLLSAHAQPGAGPQVVLAAAVPQGVRRAELLGIALQLAGAGHRAEERAHSLATIHRFVRVGGSGPADTLALAIHRGVVVVSPSEGLVEQALRQLNGETSLLDNADFQAIMAISGTRVDANLFIHHGRLTDALMGLVAPAHREGFGALATAGSWTELDLVSRPDALWLNGFTSAADSAALYHVLARQQPQPLTLPVVLPAQTGAFLALGISDLDTYLASHREYLQAQGQLTAHRQGLEALGATLGMSPAELYGAFFGRELALGYLPPHAPGVAGSWFVVAGTRGLSQAQGALLGAIERFAQRSGLTLSAFERPFRVDRDKQVMIYRWPAPGLHRALFGRLFALPQDQYLTFIDSYAVFGPSPEVLAQLILAHIHSKSLAQDPSFRQFSESLAPQSNFTAYINPSRAAGLLHELLTSPAAQALTARAGPLAQLQGVAIQLSGGPQRVFNNLVARYTPYAAHDPQTVWEVRLDTTLSMKPQLVINHHTGHREILVQDHGHTLYLINHAGRTLWRAPLGEPIMGQVHQVDMFRNGRLQYLFSTRSAIHCIDRNGNSVEGFPIRLRAPASNPVAVFDYEGDHDYRFLIAGQDRRVYAYNRQGHLLKGWEFDRTETPVTLPIQHFRIEGRDYIVLADANRPYILDRRGRERVRPARLFPPGQQSPFGLLTEQGTHHLVTTDTLGIVRLIGLDGRVTDRPVRPLGATHTFLLQDVDADGRPDFLFLHAGTLHAYTSAGHPIFKREFPCGLSPQIIHFHFGPRNHKLGLVCPLQAQIFLVNGQGALYHGFPLRGSTPFSIGRFANTQTRFNLIVGAPQGLLLNYAVH